MASIKRKIVRHLENQMRNNTHQLNYMRDYVEDMPSQENVMIQGEEQLLGNHQLLQGMNLLSRRQREAIQLKYFENLDTEQISASMRINNQSVYNLIFGALRVMKEGMINKSFAGQ
jgi:DNA-directed RNA polymerase specialized sigma24 family protein